MKEKAEHKGMPAALPSAYQQIWKALSEADELASSRQELARVLGLSTHTIQRILVDGEVPEFPETRNTRVVRSWVRILTRLAFHAGVEPRRWIESVGLPWSDEIQRASGEASRRAAARFRQAQTSAPALSDVRVRPGSLPDGATGSSAARWPQGLRAGIRVGIADRIPLASALSGFGSSFLEEYARRVVLAVSPDSAVSFHRMDERAVVSALTSSAPALDLGVGIAETVDRKALGLEFVPLPGWSVRLVAMCLRRKADHSQLPTWQEVISLPSPPKTTFVVSSDGIAARFLRGQCGVSADRLVVVPSSVPDEIAQVLLAETERRDGSTLLVADEQASVLVAERLHLLPRVIEAYSVERLKGAEQEFPTYPLAMAVGPGLGSPGRDLLEEATREMFASAPTRAAYLYAAALARSILERDPLDVFDTGSARGILTLADFTEASAGFRRELVNGLVNGLSRGLEQKLESSRLLPADAGHAEIARRLAVRFVRSMVPVEWTAGIDVSQIGVPASLHCLSCAAPLEDARNKGPSDRYCRHCSDEQGRLKPRPEVEQILAGWLAYGRSDLTPDEATRRARRYMEAMPAWCNN